MNIGTYTTTKYVVALYLRLSRDDGDREESESISNQRKILRAYAEENGYIIYDEYVDDGYSGTNFDRPDFIRMMKDIENKKVNMVITKSLSRLGRDYIETGRLIEKFFPENNIRYIAILDDVDTLLDSKTDFVALKNIMNDFYAKETSKNIKKTKNRKRKEEGFYYISIAPFGYKKINIKGDIEIVESQAKIVRKIFKEYISGKGTFQIAKLLNAEGILPPGLQMKLPNAVMHETKITSIWDCTQVKRILENPVYIGKVIQNKTKKINYKVKKKIKTAKEEYIIIDNHHEPIIDMNTWETAKNIRNSQVGQRIKSSDELLKPFLYCSHCHNKLSIIHRKRNNKSGDKIDTYAICATAVTKKSNRICYRQYNTYHIIEEKVFDNIKETIKEYLEYDAFNNKEAMERLLKNQKGREDIETKLVKIRKELEGINNKLQMLYKDRLNKIIEEEDYILFSEGLKSQRNKLTEIEQGLKKEIDCYNNQDIIEKIQDNIKEEMKKIITGEAFNKENLSHLINRIEIDKDKNITIKYKFFELNCIGGNKYYEKTGS